MSLVPFLKLAIALIKGDDAEATALRIQKRAVAALKAQIAAKEAHTLTLEDVLESALENLEKRTVNNGVLIEDNITYITELLKAQRAIKEAEEKLEDHKASILFLQNQLIKTTKA